MRIRTILNDTIVTTDPAKTRRAAPRRHEAVAVPFLKMRNTVQTKI
jgi:hypothetical protein